LTTIAVHIGTLGLQLTVQKTEAVVFNLKRGATLPDIKLQGQPVVLSESLKYIDITFEGTGTMVGSHLRDVSEKTQRVMAVLGRLMPNVGGP
jgi:hypothetical protein